MEKAIRALGTLPDSSWSTLYIFLFSLSLSVQRICIDSRNTIREEKIRISNLICINPSFRLVAGSPISSQLLFQPHLISKSYSKTGWQNITWHCLYSGCTCNLHNYKILYTYKTPLSQRQRHQVLLGLGALASGARIGSQAFKGSLCFLKKEKGRRVERRRKKISLCIVPWQALVQNSISIFYEK